MMSLNGDFFFFLAMISECTAAPAMMKGKIEPAALTVKKVIQGNTPQTLLLSFREVPEAASDMAMAVMPMSSGEKAKIARRKRAMGTQASLANFLRSQRKVNVPIMMSPTRIKPVK